MSRKTWRVRLQGREDSLQVEEGKKTRANFPILG